MKTALDILLSAKDEQGNSLALDEIKDQVLVQLYAGHDTTSSVMSSTLYYLYSYPEVLQKLRDEIQQTFPDKEQPFDFQKLKEMKYLDCVIKEVVIL